VRELIFNKRGLRETTRRLHIDQRTGCIAQVRDVESMLVLGLVVSWAGPGLCSSIRLGSCKIGMFFVSCVGYALSANPSTSCCDSAVVPFAASFSNPCPRADNAGMYIDTVVLHCPARCIIHATPPGDLSSSQTSSPAPTPGYHSSLLVSFCVVVIPRQLLPWPGGNCNRVTPLASDCRFISLHPATLPSYPPLIFPPNQ
jgi:hypothetical protein